MARCKKPIIPDEVLDQRLARRRPRSNFKWRLKPTRKATPIIFTRRAVHETPRTFASSH